MSNATSLQSSLRIKATTYASKFSPVEETAADELAQFTGE